MPNGVQDASGGGKVMGESAHQHNDSVDSQTKPGSSDIVTPSGYKGRGTGPGVRDAAQASTWLDKVKQGVARFQDFDVAKAQGYTRNPASGGDAIQHYIHSAANGRADAGDLNFPATLMYKTDTGGKPRLVGVMLTGNPDRPLPDFGAGAWHRHPGDNNVHMHVWFDKTVNQGAFENNLGYV